MIKTLFAAASVAALTCALAPAQAQSWDFEAGQVYVFGDSLSDTGNILIAAGQGGPPVYFNGRFSNGPVWHELLTAQPLALSPFLGGIVGDPSGGINFAHGGARTVGFETSPGGPVLPGSLEQAQSFAAGVANNQIAAPDANDIFAVWIGGNNFLSALGSGGSPDIAQGVGEVQATLATLAGAGAQRIVLFSLPLIGDSVDAPDGIVSALNLATRQFNTGLRQVDQAVSAQFGADILYVNIEALFSDVFANPAAYGFSEVDDDCVSNGLLLDNCPADWSDYDGIHPTRQAHAVVAQFVVASGANVDGAGAALGGLTEFAYQSGRRLIVDGLDEAARRAGDTGAYLSGGWLDGEVDPGAAGPGLDYDGWTLAVGVGAAAENGFFIGGRGAYADQSGTVGGALPATADSETFGLSVHAGWRGEALYALAGLGLGRSELEAIRSTGFAPRSSVSGDLAVDHSFVALEGGIDVALGAATLTPYIRAVLTEYEFGAFRESGPLLAGVADAMSFESTLYELGARAHWALSDTRRLDLLVGYEAEDDAARTVALLLNDVDLSTAQLEAADDGLFRVAGGYEAAITERLSVSANAGGRFGDATQTLQATFDLRWRF